MKLGHLRKTALMSLVTKIITIIGSIVTIPIALGYLGLERFGVWLSITTLASVFVFADFGVSNGLLNSVAAAHGRSDHIEIKKKISNSMFVVALACCFILIAYFLVCWIFDGYLAVYKKNIEDKEISGTLTVVVITQSIAMLTAPAQKAQLATHQGYQTELWNLFGAIAGFLGIIVAADQRASLPILTLASLGAPAAAGVLNALHYFLISRPQYIPSPTLVTSAGCREVLKTGALFFFLQFTATISYALDNIIVAAVLGPAAVGTYAIAAKIPSMIFTFAALGLKPYWPAYAEAKSQQRWDWISETLKKSTVYVVAFTLVAAIVTALFGSRIIAFWTSNNATVPFGLLSAICVWTVVQSIGLSYSMMLNGIQAVRLQIVVGVLFAGLSMPIKWLTLSNLGLAFLPISVAVLYILTTIFPYHFNYMKIIQRRGV